MEEGDAMLKEWIWWQIEASLEHLGDENTIPLSDMTICFWMALTVNRCIGLFQEREVDDFVPEGGQAYGEADGVSFTAFFMQSQVFDH
jgi:hypothetical protein